MGKRARKVYVVGHKNPDTDSICSAIAYAELKRTVTGNDYVARRAGQINEETHYVLNKFGVSAPALLQNVKLQVKDMDIHKIDVQFRSDAGSVLVCKDGMGTDFSEPLAKEVLMRDEISIDIDLKSGDACASAFGCDLTYDYVKINGDYRT